MKIRVRSHAPAPTARGTGSHPRTHGPRPGVCAVSALAVSTGLGVLALPTRRASGAQPSAGDSPGQAAVFSWHATAEGHIAA